MITKPGLELMKEMYFHEIQVKEMLNSRIQVPFTILSILIAILTYMKTNAPPLNPQPTVAMFMFGVISSSIFILFALFNLCKAMVARDIVYLPTPKIIADYITQEERYYQEQQMEITKSEYITNQLNELIYKHIVEHSSANFDQNVSRINSIRDANYYLMASLVATVWGFFMYVLL